MHYRWFYCFHGYPLQYRSSLLHVIWEAKQLNILYSRKLILKLLTSSSMKGLEKKQIRFRLSLHFDFCYWLRDTLMAFITLFLGWYYMETRSMSMIIGLFLPSIHQNINYKWHAHILNVVDNFPFEWLLSYSLFNYQCMYY